MLILGGVSHTKLLIYPLNRFYSRIAEDLRTAERDVDVVLVDPDDWEGGGGVTKHYQMTLEDYAQDNPLDELLSKYKRVCIVDDMKFRDFRKRSAIEASDEYKQLVSIANLNKDRVSWWEFFSKDEWGESEIIGIRELNHVRAKEGGPYINLDIIRTLMFIRFWDLYNKELIETYEFGEAPAPEGLLDKLFWS